MNELVQMNELKADNTFVFGEECLVYKKSEADNVIAKKNKAITLMKAEIRRLRRALWLSRLQSLRNFSVLAYFQTIRAKGKKSNMDFNEMAYRIDLARVKCRAKADEYK